jgi:hypothetical protein
VSAAATDILKAANDALAFLLELVAIAAFVAWGLAAGPSRPVRVLLAVAAPVALIVVWAVWLAPRSDRRLDMPWLLMAKIAVFALATVALVVAGHPWLAAAFGTVAGLNLMLALRWGRV